MRKHRLHMKQDLSGHTLFILYIARQIVLMKNQILVDEIL